jgi:PAS domain-containing protein
LETAFAEYISHGPVLVRQIGGEIVYWAEGARELYGFDETVGRKSHELAKMIDP